MCSYPTHTLPRLSIPPVLPGRGETDHGPTQGDCIPTQPECPALGMDGTEGPSSGAAGLQSPRLELGQKKVQELALPLVSDLGQVASALRPQLLHRCSPGRMKLSSQWELLVSQGH